MSYTHPDGDVDYRTQHPHLPPPESDDPEGFAQADLLYFTQTLDPAADKLMPKHDVVTLFVAAFGYARSTFDKTNHAELVDHRYYRADYAYRTDTEGQSQSCTRYLKSRVIELIREIKSAVAERRAPSYPHERASEGEDRPPEDAEGDTASSEGTWEPSGDESLEQIEEDIFRP